MPINLPHFSLSFLCVTQAELAKAKPTAATPQTSSSSSAAAAGPPPPPPSSTSKPVNPVKPAAAPVPSPRKTSGSGSSKDEEVLRKVQELQKKKAELQKQKDQQSKVGKLLWVVTLVHSCVILFCSQYRLQYCVCLK